MRRVRASFSVSFCALAAFAMLPSAFCAEPTKAATPPSIAEVGELGENVYDLAKDNDWTKAEAKLALLVKEAESLHAQVKDEKAKGKLDKYLAALKTSVAAKDQPVTMQQANKVTKFAADLSAPFHPQIPVDVTMLDYYGRELEVWSAAKNDKKLKKAADSLETTWAKVRPSVKEHGGEKQATTFDGLVAKLKAATSAEQYKGVATPILDEVDNLEKVFTK